NRDMAHAEKVQILRDAIMRLFGIVHHAVRQQLSRKVQAVQVAFVPPLVTYPHQSSRGARNNSAKNATTSRSNSRVSTRYVASANGSPTLFMENCRNRLSS